MTQSAVFRFSNTKKLIKKTLIMPLSNFKVGYSELLLHLSSTSFTLFLNEIKLFNLQLKCFSSPLPSIKKSSGNNTGSLLHYVMLNASRVARESRLLEILHNQKPVIGFARLQENHLNL